MASSDAPNDPTVRYAEEKDVPLILSIIRDLALYEKEPESCLATEDSLLKTLSFGDSPSKGYARTILIFSPPSAIPPGIAGPQPDCAGMALYFNNYSTWRAAPGIYLEDLFIRPEYRGRGYGKKLLQELAREVKKIGGTRLEWSVLRWNQPSIDFYEGLGAKKQDEWWGMRVDFAALDKLAEGPGLQKN